MAAAERRGRIWQGDPSAALSLLSASAVVSVAAAFFLPGQWIAYYSLVQSLDG